MQGGAMVRGGCPGRGDDRYVAQCHHGEWTKSIRYDKIIHHHLPSGPDHRTKFELIFLRQLPFFSPHLVASHQSGHP
ncbi:hypothetical protein BJX70DRAFT_15810 [Aspergillus crustosus]